MTNRSSEVAPGVWLDEYCEGHFMMIEKGKASVFIHRGASPKSTSTTAKVGTAPFQMRVSGHGAQEIVDADGRIVARTTDEVAGELICKLLNLYKKVKG